MNPMDQQKVARVWQRVQESKPAPQPERLSNLEELIMNEWMAAATYQQLSRQMQSGEAAVLRRMAREEQSHGACLRGMHFLVNGEKYRVQQQQIQKEPLERALRRCYGQELRSLRAYEAHCDDPEYGHVFARIAQQEREHCMALLVLLGGLEKK